MTRLISILIPLVTLTMASPGWSQVHQGPLASEPALQRTWLDAWDTYDRSGRGSERWLGGPPLADAAFVIRGQETASGGGGGNLAGDATNPTSNLTQYQVQNTFIPSTYEASGFAHTLGLQMVKPFETGGCFFPTWITRTTLPVVTTADPDGVIPIGPPNESDFSIPLDNQSGLSDLVFISLLNHPTDWGSWGIGPGFVAPTASRVAAARR